MLGKEFVSCLHVAKIFKYPCRPVQEWAFQNGPWKQYLLPDKKVEMLESLYSCLHCCVCCMITNRNFEKGANRFQCKQTTIILQDLLMHFSFRCKLGYFNVSSPRGRGGLMWFCSFYGAFATCVCKFEGQKWVMSVEEEKSQIWIMNKTEQLNGWTLPRRLTQACNITIHNTIMSLKKWQCHRIYLGMLIT